MLKKTLVITGVSRGIGLKTAELFSDRGWRVVGLSRTPSPRGDFRHFSVDLSRSDWERDVRGALEAEFAGAERLCVIHNAAGYNLGALEAVSPDQVREDLEIGVVGPLKLNQILLPHMAPGSSILYVGSTLSEKAAPGAASYVVSKHAVVGLMRATCQDFGARRIHTACVCPGFTDTDILKSRIQENPGQEAAITSKVLFQRLIRPEEIAETLYFCAENPAINGSVIHANLGQVER